MPRTPKQEDFLATARKSQEIMVDAIRTWVETVRTASPRLSSVYAPFAERLSKVPSVYAPLAGKLPSPKDAVESAYDLAERLLANQRKFAEELVEATKPLMPGYGASKPQDHAGAAPQDHADSAPQGHGESIPEGSTEAALEETPAAKTPRATGAKSTTKTAAARQAPKSTGTSRTPKSTAARRAPKSSDAG